MNNIKWILLSWVLCATSSWGAIGETAAQCDARYGAPFEEVKEGSRREYFLGVFRIYCWFHEGACDAVSYMVVTPSMAIDHGTDILTETQSMAFLKINADDWVRCEIEEYEQQHHGLWKSRDGKLNAKVFGFMVTIETIDRTRRSYEELQEKNINAAIEKMGAGKLSVEKPEK